MNMDLCCNEPILRDEHCLQDVNRSSSPVPEYIAALADPVLLNDHRVLEKLLISECRGFPSDPCIIYDSHHSEIKPHMRQVLTAWMLEVCEELQCELIFPSAVNYLDRVLSKISVPKKDLQLLGSVCLLVASKLRQCKSIHPEDLVFLSDLAFSVNDIMEWEMLLLTTLKWDVSVVVSTDFIDHLLARLHLSSDSKSAPFVHLMEEVKRSAIGLCLLCSKEIDFLNEKPSSIATACVGTSLESLLQPVTFSYPGKGLESFSQIKERLQEITGISREDLDRCLHKLSCFTDQENTAPSLALQSNLVSNSCNNKQHSNSSKNCTKQNAFSSQPETPTDVQDVIF